MSVSVSFLELFDKTTNSSFCGISYGTDSFEVNEYDPNPSDVPLTHLQVNQEGAYFTSFTHSLIKGMKCITETRSNHLLDSDCDGIAFVDHEAHEGLIFAELKSRFNVSRIVKAYKQMVFSFLKMHAMLCLCKDYFIDKISLQLIAACQCFENTDQEDSVYDRISKAELLSDLSFEGVLLRRLIEQRYVSIKLGEITDIWNLPLCDALTQKELILTLHMTENYGDESTVYSIT